MNKIAFVCDTPYQLFVMLSLILSEESIWYCKKDLYIDIRRSKKSNMYKYFKNIFNENIFDNIYVVNSLSTYYKGLNKVEWLFPKLSLFLGSDFKIPFEKKYDSIWVSGPFMLQRNIINFFKPQKIMFFEDGTGSYIGRIGIDLLNNYGKLLQKITKRGPMHIYPTESYVFCPNLYVGDYKKIIKKIDFPNNEIHYFNNIFGGTRCDSYSGKKIIYLSQPISDDLLVTDEKILDIISLYFKNTIVRPHPQDVDKNFKNLEVDDSKVMWEIICQEYITEDSILIGMCSTAQISAKLIYDKEPYIIFTHCLYNSDRNQRFNTLINSVKSIYTNKEKIIVPRTYEELLMNIERLVNKKKD